METIRAEAITNSLLPTDLDRLRSRYRDTKYDSLGNLLTEVYFPAGEIYTYENYLFRLMVESETVNFIPRWTYRPDYVSFDYYRTVIHWALILCVNRIDSIENFVGLETILVPNKYTVLEISKLNVSDINVFELVESGTEDNFNEARFFKAYPLDSRELEQIRADKALEDPFAIEDEEDFLCPACPPCDCQYEWIIDGGIY